MAKATIEVIEALRQTAHKLAESTTYEWGHMGACNCGFLAQEITNLRKDEIHRRAMQGYGDWSEQLRDYCPTSGLPMDALISEMIAFGFDADDLTHLERLSHPAILAQIPLGKRHLRHNIKRDVVLYLNTWANLLELELVDQVELKQLLQPQPAVTV